MSTSVATELMARDSAGALPFRLRRVGLSNGGLIVSQASLRPIQKVLRSPLDPVATTNVLAGLRELRPAARVVDLPELGHYAQVEDPAVFAAGVRELLG